MPADLAPQAPSASHSPDLPSAVLFDMDGTLVDTEPLWLLAEQETMAWLEGPWTQDDQRLCLGGPLERVVDHMRARSGTSVPAEAVQDRVLSAVERLMREEPLVWRPGARALLEECAARGVPTALVTASWRTLVDAMHVGMVADLGREPFDAIVAGDDVRESKPHPEPYETAATLLGHPTSSCLALEDSPTGIRSAVMAGCRVVAVPHLAGVPDDLAPGVADSLERPLADLWAVASAAFAAAQVAGA